MRLFFFLINFLLKKTYLHTHKWKSYWKNCDDIKRKMKQFLKGKKTLQYHWTECIFFEKKLMFSPTFPDHHNHLNQSPSPGKVAFQLSTSIAVRFRKSEFVNFQSSQSHKAQLADWIDYERSEWVGCAWVVRVSVCLCTCFTLCGCEPRH